MDPIRPPGGENKSNSISPPNLTSLSLSSLHSPSSSTSFAMEDLPLQKVTISGPTLSSLINRFISSPSNIQGLLFGKLSLHTPSLSDDSPSPSPSPSSLIATVTGFISSGNSSTDLSSLLSRQHHRHMIGWFSGRRRSPLRPSLREFAITHSFSSDSPRIFLLLTTPSQDSQSQTLIHTHEYKVYQFHRLDSSFETMPLDVVNIGPAFRGQYSAFSPNSELPYLACEVQGGSPMREDGSGKENLKEMKRVAKDQKELGMYVEGYELGSLSRLMGSDAVNYMGGVEELYEKMLAKLHSLARQVETSSAKVLEMVSFLRFTPL